MPVPFFTAIPSATWDDAAECVQAPLRHKGQSITVRVPRSTFTELRGRRVSPEECVQAYGLNRTAFEHAAIQLVKAGRLSEDGSVTVRRRHLSLA